MIAVLFTAGCSKEESDQEEMTKDPSISFVSLAPTEVDNFKNVT